MILSILIRHWMCDLSRLLQNLKHFVIVISCVSEKANFKDIAFVDTNFQGFCHTLVIGSVNFQGYCCLDISSVMFKASANF